MKKKLELVREEKLYKRLLAGLVQRMKRECFEKI